MTETSTPAATAEFPVCADCAIVIVNGDTSGLEDAEAHLAAMDRELSGLRHVVVSDADTGFRTDTCGACGVCTGTDEWFAGTAEIIEEN